MIIFYYGTSSYSCRQTAEWFKEHQITVYARRIEHISKTDLIHALTLSEQGFYDVLKRQSMVTTLLQKKIKEALTLSFNDSIDYILKHPEILKVPLILDEQKLVLGYNAENMRTFIPRNYRGIKRAINIQNFLS